jgi:ABC-type Mn2+/Zn2+ transport system ATPase subunit
MKPENKLELSNIGLFDQKNEIILSDLTVVCGMNDSGKTTVGKLLYALIKLQKFNVDVDWIKKFNSSGTKLVGSLLNFEKISNSSIDINENMEQKEAELRFFNENNFKKMYTIICEYQFNEVEVNFKDRDFFRASEILKDIISIMDYLFKQQYDRDFEVNNFLKEMSAFALAFLIDLIEIFKMFFKNASRNVFAYRRIIEAADSFKNILKISIDNNFDESKIYEQIMKPESEKYFVNLFEGTNNMISKYSTKNDAYFKLNFGYDEIGIDLRNEMIDKFQFSPLFSIKDVTYCEDLADNFMGNNFKIHMRDDNGISSISSFDLYHKIEYQSLFEIGNGGLSSNIINYLTLEKYKLDLIEEITRITRFENDFNIDERTFTKDKQKIHFKNISKGIKTFQAIIKMIEADIFEEGNLVIMDEIESYLHPNFQDQFVQVLIKIINITKCKIVISTHSPIIIDSLSYRNKNKVIDISYNYVDTNEERTSSSIKHYNEGYEISEILSRVYRFYV